MISNTVVSPDKSRGYLGYSMVTPPSLPQRFPFESKVGVLRPVQQPGSYWDRSSELPLVGLKPTEVTAYD